MAREKVKKEREGGKKGGGGGRGGMEEVRHTCLWRWHIHSANWVALGMVAERNT